MYVMLRGKKGQAIAGEYVILVTLVLAALGGITVYVKRAYQARIRDAGASMMYNVANHLGQNVLLEYEPYYVSTRGDRDEASYDSTSIGEGLYMKYSGTNGVSVGLSNQLPPKDAN